MTPNPTQSARMPEEIWAVEVQNRGTYNRISCSTLNHDHDEDCTKYIRSDLAIPKDKLQGWIEVMDRLIHDPGGDYVPEKAMKKLAEMREMVR